MRLYVSFKWFMKLTISTSSLVSSHLTLMSIRFRNPGFWEGALGPCVHDLYYSVPNYEIKTGLGQHCVQEQ